MVGFVFGALLRYFDNQRLNLKLISQYYLMNQYLKTFGHEINFIKTNSRFSYEKNTTGFCFMHFDACFLCGFSAISTKF